MSDALPKCLEKFIHESLEQMNERQLRAWARKSKKIMNLAQNRIKEELDLGRSERRKEQAR